MMTGSKIDIQDIHENLSHLTSMDDMEIEIDDINKMTESMDNEEMTEDVEEDDNRVIKVTTTKHDHHRRWKYEKQAKSPLQQK